MTTANHIASPSPEELALWTSQTLDWFETNNRQRISKDLKADLAERGARWCPKCQQALLIEDFQKDASAADSLRSRCRPCQNNMTRKHIRELRVDPEYRQREREYMHNRYRTDELYRLNVQLDRGYRRAVKAGNPAEWITAEDMLTFWSEKGIDPLTCALTGAALTPQTRGIDHATPISRGGSHQLSNLIPVSFEANTAKGTRTLLEFLADRAANQDPEDLPDLVRKAMETSTPVRKKRTVVVSLEEEGTDA